MAYTINQYGLPRHLVLLGLMVIRSHLRNSYSSLLKANQKNFFCLSIKILNLTKEKLRAIAKNRKVNKYKSMPEDELICAINRSKPINNNKKEDKKSLFNSERKEIKKVFTSQLFLNQK